MAVQHFQRGGVDAALGGLLLEEEQPDRASARVPTMPRATKPERRRASGTGVPDPVAVAEGGGDVMAPDGTRGAGG
ncbi:hypothetical protein C2142_18155 [Streptomyces sp. CB01881]|nr:hypothetical protein C2142_18155 [Streptomyces sp. CB01881]